MPGSHTSEEHIREEHASFGCVSSGHICLGTYFATILGSMSGLQILESHYIH